jgi:hypothetical protein
MQRMHLLLFKELTTMSFKVNKNTLTAIKLASTTGLDRFKVTPDQLNGCFFRLSVDQLVDESQMINNKLALLANRRANDGTSVSANRIMSASYDLAEIEFCLGLFAIAYSAPDMFEVDGDTTAEDIYYQLLDKKDKLPKSARERFTAAEFTMDKAGDALGRVVKGIQSVNNAVGNAGVTAYHWLGKKAKPQLGKFGKWLATAASK